MEPEFPVGSMVFVHQIEPADIAVGDNATFYRSDGAVVTHQVYEVDPAAQMIGTQGIANKNSDGSIMHDAEQTPFSRVIGTVSFCVPYLASSTHIARRCRFACCGGRSDAADRGVDSARSDGSRRACGQAYPRACEGAAFIAAGKSVGGGRGRCRGKRFSKGRERWKTRRKSATASLPPCCCWCWLRRGTYAWLTATQTKVNEFTVGSIDKPEVKPDPDQPNKPGDKPRTPQWMVICSRPNGPINPR